MGLHFAYLSITPTRNAGLYINHKNDAKDVYKVNCCVLLFGVIYNSKKSRCPNRSGFVMFMSVMGSA